MYTMSNEEQVFGGRQQSSSFHISETLNQGFASFIVKTVIKLETVFLLLLDAIGGAKPQHICGCGSVLPFDILLFHY